MIRVVSTIGLHTIQDAGRSGYRSYGVPVGGAMDDFAFVISNLLVNNVREAAVIEVCTGKLTLSFDEEYLLAITGFAVATVNGKSIPAWHAFRIVAGDILEIQAHPSGNFAYLSVAGGWNSDTWLGSSCTYLPLKTGGYSGRGLQKEDILKVKNEQNQLSQTFLAHLKASCKKFEAWGIAPSLFPDYLTNTIRIIKGQEKDDFTAESSESFLHQEYQVSNDMNRMAILVKDVSLKRTQTKEMLSVAVQKGTMQITPNNTLYILMSDAQTTGGYPRIGQIASVDIAVCAQLRSSRKFRFSWVSVNEAVDLLRKRSEQLKQLQFILQKKYHSYLH